MTQVTVTSKYASKRIKTDFNTWTGWVDELYSNHQQEHDIDWKVSEEVLKRNGYLEFPWVSVEIVK